MDCEENGSKNSRQSTGEETKDVEQNGTKDEGGDVDGEEFLDKAKPMDTELMARKCKVVGSAKDMDTDSATKRLEGFPSVENVHVPPKKRNRSQVFRITFKDQQSFHDFRKNEFSKFFDTVKPLHSDYENQMSGPFGALHREFRRIWSPRIRYYKAHRNTEDIQKEVMVHLLRDYRRFGGPTMKRILEEEGGVKGIQRIRHIAFTSDTTGKLFVLFDTKENADAFCERAMELKYFEKPAKCMKCIEMETTKEIYNLGTVLGDPDIESRDPERTVYFALFSEGMQRLNELKELAKSGDPEETKELSVDLNQCIFKVKDMAQPVLMVVYSSKEKAQEIVMGLTPINNNKTSKEMIFGIILNQMDDWKLQYELENKADEKQSMDLMKIQGERVFMKNFPEFLKPHKETKKFQDEAVKTGSDGQEFGNWIVCTLSPNDKHVVWLTKDIQEIGRYFFENHANVLELKMNQSDIVYVRFRSPADAEIFVKLPYVLFLGIPVTKVKFLESEEYKSPALRNYLAGWTDKSTRQKPFIRPDDERIQIHLTGFTEKFTNADLFDKMVEEITFDKDWIYTGDWIRNRVYTGDTRVDTWEAKVSTTLTPEEAARYVIDWNNKEIRMGHSLIKAALTKAKWGKKAQKRWIKGDEYGDSDRRDKKIFLENY